MKFQFFLSLTAVMCSIPLPDVQPSPMQRVCNMCHSYIDTLKMYGKNKYEEFNSYIQQIRDNVKDKVNEFRERGKAKYEDEDVPDMSKEQFEEVLRQLTEKLKMNMGAVEESKEEESKDKQDEKPL